MSVATLIDLVLAAFAVEAAALLVWGFKRRSRRTIALLPTLLSGVCLVAALRAVAHQAAWTVVAAWLVAAGCAHALDLVFRLHRSS